MSTTQTESVRNRTQFIKDRLEAIGTAYPGTHSPDETQRLLHELQVHQVELEIQNEELQHALDEKEKMEVLLGTFSDLYDFAPAGYFNLDRNGIIHAVNLTGAGYLGVERSLLNNRHLDIFISKETQPVFHDFLDMVFAGGFKETCEVVFLNAEHSPLFVQIEAVVCESRKNCRAVVTDITERKRAEEALRERENCFKSIFSHSPIAIGIGVLQSDLIVEVNDAWLQLFEYDREEVVGRTTAELSLYVRNEERDDIISSINKQGGIVNFPVQLRQKSGSLIDILYSAELITIDSKPYLQAMMTDITERKLTEEALRKSEYFFKESQRSASIGSYYSDFIAGTWESSEVLDTIFGIDIDYNRSIPGWLDIVHPDDREKMDMYLREEIISNRKPFSNEYRIIRKNDGETRWVNGRGSVEFDNDGNIISMTGTIQDITDRKHVEDNLLESEESFRAVFENALVGTMLLTPEGQIVKANLMMENLLGYMQNELNILDIKSISFPDDFEIDRDLNQSMLDGWRQSYQIEKRFVSKYGTVLWGMLSATVVRNSSGTPRYIVNMIEDISARKGAEEQLQYQSTHDNMTNLHNRSYFDEQFSRMQLGMHMPVSVIIIDLDGLKQVNDTKGHEAGDRLIIAAAKIMRMALQEKAIAARIGGDEFAILLPETNEEEVGPVVEQLRKCQADYNKSSHGRSVEFSLGMATAYSGDQMITMWKHADDRMYAEKSLHKKDSLLRNSEPVLTKNVT